MNISIHWEEVLDSVRLIIRLDTTHIYTLLLKDLKGDKGNHAANVEG
jgi:hypothetical protein